MRYIQDVNNSIIKGALFIVNPFIGLFLSLHEIKSKSSLRIFFLFIVLFGIAFTVPSGRTEYFTGDGAVYRLRFDRVAELTSREFIESYIAYFQFSDGEKDFYATALSFIVSRFTENYHWLFFIYSVFFGYFLINSFKFLISSPYYRNTLYCALLAFAFVFSNSFVNINGVRFWTASWIGVYAIFHIFLKGNNIYFLLAALTPLIHVSFFVFLFVILVAFFFKKYNNFWFILFIISFFVSNLSKDLLAAVQGFLPIFISKTVDLYLDEDIAAQISESRVWYATVFSYVKVLVLNTTIIILYNHKDKIRKIPHVYNLYLFLMVWMTFVNFTIAVPSLGGRFLMLAIPITIYIWLHILERRKYFNWLLLFIFSFSLDFLGQISLMLKVTEIDFYLFSPVYFAYKYLFL